MGASHLRETVVRWRSSGDVGSDRPVQSPTPSLFTGVNLSHYFILSEPQFCHVRDGDCNFSTQRTESQFIHSYETMGFSSHFHRGDERGSN